MVISLDHLLSKAIQHPSSTLVINDIQGARCEVSYPDLVDHVQRLKSQLLGMGLGPGHQVGIDAPNCYEWILWDLAASSLGAIVVAIPGELRHRRLPNIIKEYGLSLLVNGGLRPLSDDPSTVHLDRGMEDTSEKRVSSHAQPESNPDLFSRTFSSGTSGHLKGLDISKRGTEALLASFISGFALSPEDKHLALLPLTSYQQRILLRACLLSGASIEFSSLSRVSEDLKQAQPTFLLSPPVLYETLLEKFDSEESGESLADALGGNIRFLVTGMAPSSKTVLHRFNDAGLKLIEAYGVTEVGIVAFNPIDDNRIGTVGKALWPDDVVIDESGVILVRREHPLSLGYFLDPTGESSKVFLENGCINTGDVGEVDGDGYITIKGRSKDVIVTRAGKKLHPSELEARLTEIPGVSQVSIVQTKDALEIVAIVIVKDASDPGVTSAIEARIAKLNELFEQGLRIARVVFSDTSFSMENGCLTRNLKKNRSGIYRRFSDRVENTRHRT